MAEPLAPSPGSSSPGEAGRRRDRATSLAATRAWDRVAELLLAVPPGRFSPEFAALLAEAAAWTKPDDGARQAGMAAIGLDMRPAKRAAIAAHRAAGGWHVLAWLVLTADPNALVAPGAAGRVAATVSRVARDAADPAWRAAASEARRRPLNLGAQPAERLAEVRAAGPAQSPPGRA